MNNAFILTVPLALFCGIASPADADLLRWEVAAIAKGAGFTMRDIDQPVAVDIGPHSGDTNGGVTYEFIVNASGVSASNTLMGAYYPDRRVAFAIKFVQYPYTMRYGVTVFNQADFDSGVDVTLNEDVHLAFVSDSASTMSLYVNGSHEATMTESDSRQVSPAFVLDGVVGIGTLVSGFDSATGLPRLDDRELFEGTILGVAVYDAALSGEQIQDNYFAFSVPEPTSAPLITTAWLVSFWRFRGTW